jgi:hypothetical protein
MKRVWLLVVSVLLAGLLTGCGSSDSSGGAGGGAGASPTVKEFCQPFVDMVQTLTTKGATMSDADAVKLAKDLAQKLKDVGTPADMPADAKRGIETVVEKLLALPDDATKDEIQAAQDLTDAQKADSQALGDYITKNCVSALMPSGLPSPSAS